MGEAGSAPGHVFISYVREDSAAVDVVAGTLEAAGIRVWRDTAELVPGEDWQARIRQVISRGSVVFLACFSSAGLARERSFQRQEVMLAIEELRLRDPGVPWLIPVRLDDCAVPDWDIGASRTLGALQCVDLFGGRRDVEMARLVRTLRGVFGESPPDRFSLPSEGRAGAGDGDDLPPGLPEGIPGSVVPGSSLLAVSVLTEVRSNVWTWGGHGAVAFSPDGIVLATAIGDKTIRIWDAATGTLVRSFFGHADQNLWRGGAFAVAFSPDGTVLATGGGDGAVRIWDAATWTLVRAFSGHTGGVKSVAFSPDGALLASAGDHKTIRIWDAATGTLVSYLSGPTSAAGAYIGEAGVLMLKALTPPPAGYYDHWVSAVAFSPDGTVLATGGGDKAVRIWQTATWTLSGTLAGTKFPVRAVAFSPDGTMLATAGGDKTVRIWQTATRTLIHVLTGHHSVVNAVAFSPDGTVLATGGKDLGVGIWETATGTLIRTLTGHIGVVKALAFSPDGTVLATLGGDRTLRLWA